MELFLSFILITLLGFYVVGKLGGFLLRWWIRRKMKQFGAQAGAPDPASGQPFFWTWSSSSRGAASSGSHQKEEGTVTVTRTQNEKRISENVGEYVDFEDVNE